MTAPASTSRIQDGHGPATSRVALARLMTAICADIHADRYMIVQPSVERGPKSVRIITSNWVFDALEDFGAEGVASIIESGSMAGAGEAPLALLPAMAAFLPEDKKSALREHGHAELYCQKINANGITAFGLFSAETPCRISASALARAHMKCVYGLSQFFAATGGEAADPLSERERECLSWVSGGKTTDEVALILGVSSNTVNSYIANAIQKFGASNRAMAIATAIRSGII